MDIHKHRNRVLKHILLDKPGKDIYLKSLGFEWKDSNAHDYLAWTDFKKIYFNSQKLEGMLKTATQGQVDMDGVILHETLHNLWMHGTRGEGREFPNAWKIACEYAINHFISEHILNNYLWVIEMGGIYPSEHITRSMILEGIPFTTEGFYKYLVSQSPKEDMAQVACSCSHTGENAPAPELTDDVVNLILSADPAVFTENERDDVLKAIMEIQHVDEQPIPWEQLLLGGMEDSVEMEYSYSRPNRRNSDLPASRPEKLLSFYWILDVSPSIDQDMKNSFMSTLQAGIDKYQDAEHRVIFFANTVVGDIIIHSGDNVSDIEVPEGEGTCLDEVWKILEESKPDHALVLTDLELYPVPKPTHTQIIWGVVNDCRIFDPDYGRVIQLS